MALSHKLAGRSNRVFCIVGDGELNEGQFANYLRQSLQEFRYEQYNKCEGLPFTVAELCQKFESLLK